MEGSIEMPRCKFEGRFLFEWRNSLKAITLANRIKEKYIIEITIRDVLEFPIVEQLSEFVQKKVKDNSKKSGSNIVTSIEEGFFRKKEKK